MGIALPYSATVTTRVVAVNGEMFFGAHDATHGYQLWESNGTSNGTKMLTDVHAPYGISPAYLTAVGNTLYFTAADGPDGVQLWKSNGTPGGTTMVTDVNPGLGLLPSSLTNVQGTLYFVGYSTSAGARSTRATAPPLAP